MASSAGAWGAGGAKRRVPDPQGPVLELLRGFGVRDAGGVYDRQVRGKVLRLESSGPRVPPSAGGHSSAALKGHGGGSRHKEAQGRLQWKGMRYEEFGPLRDLWKAYIEDLQLGQGQELATGLASVDLHGSTLQVVQAKNPGCVHLHGTVIEETQKTFRIISPDNRVRMLPKERCIFELEVQGERVRLLGPAWAHRLPGGVPGPRTPQHWELP